METEKFKEDVDIITENAKENFLKDNSLIPMLFVWHTLKNGEKSMAICPILDTEKRFEISFIVGKAFKENKNVERIDAIAFASEVWMATISNKDYEKNKDFRPSDDPNKTEALFIAGMDEFRNTIIKAFEIKRDKGVRLKAILEDVSKYKSFGSDLLDNFWKGCGMIRNK